jgi:hypothetical protein
MSAYSSYDLSTSNPNPSLYNAGEQSTADTITQIANVAGQWGTAIASIVTGNPVQSVVTTQGVQTVGARGSSVYQPSTISGASGIFLLIAGFVILALIFERK